MVTCLSSMWTTDDAPPPYTLAPVPCFFTASRSASKAAVDQSGWFCAPFVPPAGAVFAPSAAAAAGSTEESAAAAVGVEEERGEIRAAPSAAAAAAADDDDTTAAAAAEDEDPAPFSCSTLGGGGGAGTTSSLPSSATAESTKVAQDQHFDARALAISAKKI